MEKLARWCFHHRWATLGLWILVIVALQGLSAAAHPSYNDDFKLPNTESKKAIDLLTKNAPKQSGDSEQIVVYVKNSTIDDPAVKQELQTMFANLQALPHVTSIDSFYDSTNGNQVSGDRKIAFVNLQLDVDGQKITVDDAKRYISVAKQAQSSNLQIELGGNAIESANSQKPASSELIGIIAAAIILFIAFGSLFTMFMPILTAIVALSAATGAIGVLTKVLSVAQFGPILAALIGLGVGIDYSLFIISRHRNNLKTGHTPEESVVIALNTSGRAVLFAGLTVCIALLGLFLVGVSFLYGVALAASMTVLFTMFTSITFLPAMLGFLGMKSLSRRERRALAANGAASKEDLSPAWYSWARTIDRHPLMWGAAALLVMLVVATPFLSLRLGSTDASTDPSGSTTRAAYDLLAKGFGAGYNGPLQIVGQVHSPADQNAFVNIADAVHATPGVASITPPRQVGTSDVWMMQAYPTTSPQAAQTSSLIKTLRKHVIPEAKADSTLQVYVGGNTAIFDDFSRVLAGKLPLFIGAVVVLAGILLMILFRSLVIPVTASLMNLLSVGAAFGVVVAVFQWGWLDGVIGIDRTGPIFAFLPILLFAILFGLSMDYEVFLVSRMHEEWIHTNDNDEAIALGQAETGRVITAAAAIMVMVFASFILGDDRIIKLFGLGLSSAILLDALVIRTILVPSIMHLLGRSNWYLPSWLDRILPHVSVDGPAENPAQAATAES